MGAGRTMVVAAVLGAAMACKDGGGGPSENELVGTWDIVKCEYVSTEGLGTVDLIAAGGSGTLALTADKRLNLTVTPVSGAAVVFSASYEIDGIDLMRVTPTGGTFYWAFDMQLSGGTLKLTNGTGWYDFDGDGMADPAKWNLEARK